MRPLQRPAQRWLLGASLVAAIGSVLPWVDTAFGTFSGLRGAGLWTFYASWLGVAGALMRRRGLALAHAVPVGLALTGLPVWQLAHLLRMGLGGGWVPGVGLVLVGASGLTVLWSAYRLRTGP